MSFEIKVKGLRELDANLNALEPAIRKRLLRPSMRKSMEPVREDASRRARRAQGGPTYPDIGHVADHIIIAVSLTKKRGAVAKVGPDKDHWYLAFQEFGTPFSPAEPVLRPALETKASEAVNILKTELGNGIEREARKLRRLVRLTGEL